jgi:hypothetical protein
LSIPSSATEFDAKGHLRPSCVAFSGSDADFLDGSPPLVDVPRVVEHFLISRYTAAAGYNPVIFIMATLRGHFDPAQCE